MGVHESSIISSEARIAADVEIGPFCMVKGAAVIGAGSRLLSHVVVHDGVAIGENNTFHQGCSIGDEPQDLSCKGEPAQVVIGDNNVFREHVTVHRGTAKDKKETRIGSDCFFMAYSHVAHDCIVGNHVVLTNCAQLAGHTEIDDHAGMSAFSGIHQFCRVGRFAFIGASTIANKDVVPFALVVPDEHARSKIMGPNLVGLKRAGFNREQIRSVRSAYKILFNSGLNTSQAVEQLTKEFPGSDVVEEILEFIAASKRGIAK